MTSHVNSTVKFQRDFDVIDVSKIKEVTLKTGSERVYKAYSRGIRILLELENKTIVIPNTCAAIYWTEIAQAELEFFDFLKMINLFTLDAKKETIHVDNIRQETYSIPKFEGLKNSGIYFLDLFYAKRSTWTSNQKLFKGPVLNPDNWHPVFNELQDDLARLVVFNVALDPRCGLLAIVKKNTQYSVRYFVQDLVQKGTSIPRPTLTSVNVLKWSEPVKKTLITLLTAVLVHEFNVFALEGEQCVLLNKLVDKYTSDILTKAKEAYAEFNRVNV